MIPRPVIVFAAILALGGFVSVWALPMRRGPVFWVVLLAAAVAGAMATRLTGAGGGRTGRGERGGNTWVTRGEFLCDSCKYDHPDLCSRPERPNATRCPDYKVRG